MKANFNQSAGKKRHKRFKSTSVDDFPVITSRQAKKPAPIQASVSQLQSYADLCQVGRCRSIPKASKPKTSIPPPTDMWGTQDNSRLAAPPAAS
ncbi:hypothetical protein GWI33_022848 [Rhynchophorus ferrugineus]|uniref:Uncharacterized protein n=1 Tax=Rhynchophorus ferrugineus TaxID=354439 RepID=A0A834ITX8_RHYFE|nr:hypothetical protein GWI33_022848 [Rhynchophorus ferrugineus]